LHRRFVRAAVGGVDRGTLVVAQVVTVGLIMAILGTTIVNVGLETLSRDLGAGLSTIQWVSTGYLLSLAAVSPLFAELSILPKEATWSSSM
jgi:MFS family permease